LATIASIVDITISARAVLSELRTVLIDSALNKIIGSVATRAIIALMNTSVRGCNLGEYFLVYGIHEAPCNRGRDGIGDADDVHACYCTVKTRYLEVVDKIG